MALTITINDIFNSFETEFGTEEFYRDQYVAGTTTYQFWQGQVSFINSVLESIDSINSQNNIYLMTSIDMLSQFTKPFGYQPIQGKNNLISLLCNPLFDQGATDDDLLKCQFKIIKRDTQTNNIIFEDTYSVYWDKQIFPGTYLIIQSTIKQELLDLIGIEVEYLNNVEGITLLDVKIGGIYFQGMGLESPLRYRERFLDTSKDFFISNLEDNVSNKYGSNISINSRLGIFDILEYNLVFLTKDVPNELLYDVVHNLGTSNLYVDPGKPTNSKDITFLDGTIQNVSYNYFDIQDIKILLAYSDESKTNDIVSQQEVIMSLVLFSFNQNNVITQKDILDYLFSKGIGWINAVSFQIRNQSFFFLEPSTDYFYQIQEDGVIFLKETTI